MDKAMVDSRNAGKSGQPLSFGIQFMVGVALGFAGLIGTFLSPPTAKP